MRDDTSIRAGLAGLALLLAFGWAADGAFAAAAQTPSAPTASAPAPGTPAPGAPTATAPAAAAQPSVPADEPIKLQGFRSATFGMTEAQVRQAIKKDFNAPDGKIAVAANPGDLTTVITVPVDDLLPDSGPAQVNYILGYKSKKLAQVTVVWGGPVNKQFKAETAVLLANLLRTHFLTEGYKPDTIVVNTPVPTIKGQIVVFRGADADGHMTALVLTELPPPPEGQPATTAPVLLQLAYILDPQNPDIFKLQKSQF